MISHDRTFLSRWRTRPCGWTAASSGATTRLRRFEAWQEETYAAEEAEEDRMDKRLAAETHWLHRGVTARRKRNMGRLRALLALRKERAERSRRKVRSNWRSRPATSPASWSSKPRV